MTTIEIDGKIYEEVGLVERTQDEIEKDISDRNDFISMIKFIDIDQLKMFVGHGLIEQEVLDISKARNKENELEKDTIESEIFILQEELNKWL